MSMAADHLPHPAARYRGAIRTFLCAVLLLIAAQVSVWAQPALQNMVAGNNADEARAAVASSLQSQNYTFKAGDFRMLVTPSAGAAWCDNVNLAQTDVMDDYIISPALGITASYPLSTRNLLYHDITVGYNWYVKHSQFSTFDLDSSSGTGLSFDLVIKQVTINFHDRVSYTQGTGSGGTGASLGNGFVGNNVNGSVANTATFGTFQNTAGLLGTWDLNQFTPSLGYDHQNVMSTSGQFNDMDRSSELVTARAGFQVHPQVTAGLEATATFTTYDQNSLNNNNAYTLGPYIEFRPGQFFRITARAGYETYQFQQTSSAIQTSSQDGWYADIMVSHDPTDWFSYSLDAGREVQLGAVSDLVEDWYVRPNATWKIIRGLDLTAFGFYEHGDQGVGSTGSLLGYSNGTFDWYGGGLSLQHALTSRLDLGLSYRITRRSSAEANSSYTQNMVALQLTYHPK